MLGFCFLSVCDKWEGSGAGRQTYWAGESSTLLMYGAGNSDTIMKGNLLNNSTCIWMPQEIANMPYNLEGVNYKRNNEQVKGNTEAWLR